MLELTTHVQLGGASHLVKFDVNIHRPRGNEKDKLLSGVQPMSNDRQRH